MTTKTGNNLNVSKFPNPYSPYFLKGERMNSLRKGERVFFNFSSLILK